jgi:integrase
MICRYCEREILDGSIFCSFCGERVARKKREKKQEIKVPKPRQLPSGAWNIELRKEDASITEATPEACTARARAIRAGFLAAEKAAPRQTLDAVVEKYIKDNTGVLSPATIRGYESIRKSRFQPSMQLDVSAVDWQAAVSAEALQVSPKTVANSWRLITGPMRHAHLPIPEVNLPRQVKKERPWLDYEQIQIFLKAIEGRKCELACLLALHSLRMSEILALQQGSVSDGKIHVRGAVVIDQNGAYVRKDTNKTAASRRDVPVMIPRLLTLWSSVDDKYQWQKHAAINEMVQSICKKAGLPEITMHGLRHSFASLAYHLNWDIMTTCAVGGWSTPTVVQGIYTHLAKQDENKDIEKMKAFYNPQITNEIPNASQTG